MRFWVNVVIGIILVVAVIISLQPVRVGKYPYNLDAITDARAAEHIVENGNMDYEEGKWYRENNHTAPTPVQNALLAGISLIAMEHPLLIGQYFEAFIFAMSILGWSILARKMTGRDFVAVGTAAFLTFFGSYVNVGVSVWKESLGICLMPYIFYLYYSENKIKKSLALLSLAILPLVHHYVALLTYLAFSYMALWELSEKMRKHEEIKMEIALLIYMSVLWIYLYFYYTMWNFNRVEYISPMAEAWLLLALFIILSFLGLRVVEHRGSEGRLRTAFFMGIVITAFFFLIMQQPLFPDTVDLGNASQFLVGYFFIVPFVVVGLILLARSDWKYKSLYFAILFAPLTMILFGFLRGFDLFSFVIIFRTFDFLDFSICMAFLFGVGYISKKIKIKKFPYRKEAILAAGIVALMSSTPMFSHTHQIFGVENYVEPWAVSSLTYLYENSVNNYSSDEHMYELGRNFYDMRGNFLLPYAIIYNQTPPSEYLILRERWIYGAQMYPERPITIDNTTLQKYLSEYDVLYISGPYGDRIYILKRY